LSDINDDEIETEIKGMCVKKGMGVDNIPPKIIKWAPELFAPILSKIFNKCLICQHPSVVFFIILSVL